MSLVFTWSLADIRCFVFQVDAVIGADGANSRVAKEIDAGEYDYAIAFQERIRIPDEKMDYYKDLAEMYVGDDVSPDFYGWVFPKYDHVAVGTGTVVNKTAIKQYQQATRDRSKVRHRLLWKTPVAQGSNALDKHSAQSSENLVCASISAVR